MESKWKMGRKFKTAQQKF